MQLLNLMCMTMLKKSFTWTCLNSVINFSRSTSVWMHSCTLNYSGETELKSKRVTNDACRMLHYKSETTKNSQSSLDRHLSLGWAVRGSTWIDVAADLVPHSCLLWATISRMTTPVLDVRQPVLSLATMRLITLQGQSSTRCQMAKHIGLRCEELFLVSHECGSPALKFWN